MINRQVYKAASIAQAVLEGVQSIAKLSRQGAPAVVVEFHRFTVMQRVKQIQRTPACIFCGLMKTDKRRARRYNRGRKGFTIYADGGQRPLKG